MLDNLSNGILIFSLSGCGDNSQMRGAVGAKASQVGSGAPGASGVPGVLGQGSPSSWLLLSSVQTDGPYSYVWGPTVIIFSILAKV